MPKTKKNKTETAADAVLTQEAPAPAPAKKTRAKDSAGTLSGPQALNQAVWAICDVLRSAGVGSATRYVPELTWILFLRMLDEQEAQDQRRRPRRWACPTLPRLRCAPLALAGLGGPLQRQSRHPHHARGPAARLEAAASCLRPATASGAITSRGSTRQAAAAPARACDVDPRRSMP